MGKSGMDFRVKTQQREQARRNKWGNQQSVTFVPPRPRNDQQADRRDRRAFKAA